MIVALLLLYIGMPATTAAALILIPLGRAYFAMVGVALLGFLIWITGAFSAPRQHVPDDWYRGIENPPIILCIVLLILIPIFRVIRRADRAGDPTARSRGLKIVYWIVALALAALFLEWFFNISWYIGQLFRGEPF